MSFVFLFPNKNQRLLPGTASMRSSLPPHMRQCHSSSVIFCPVLRGHHNYQYPTRLSGLLGIVGRVFVLERASADLVKEATAATVSTTSGSCVLEDPTSTVIVDPRGSYKWAKSPWKMSMFQGARRKSTRRKIGRAHV